MTPHPELPIGDDRLFLSALSRQVGGSHYKAGGIEPVVFFEHNRIPYCIANAIKYIFRYQKKNGRQDLEKALHYIELAIGFYQAGFKPFTADHAWRIEPEHFVASNGIEGRERDAIMLLCSVQRYGLEAYLGAHKYVTGMIGNYDDKRS